MKQNIQIIEPEGFDRLSEIKQKLKIMWKQLIDNKQCCTYHVMKYS